MINCGNYRIIKKDSLNWSIEEKYISTKGKNKGKESWKNIGYYPRFDQACICLFDKNINDDTITSLKSMSELIKVSRNRIIKSIKKNCGDVAGAN
jgi:hypothetical protein